jgi:hypothetical protein
MLISKTKKEWRAIKGFQEEESWSDMFLKDLIGSNEEHKLDREKITYTIRGTAFGSLFQQS